MRLEKAHILAQDFRATSQYVKSYRRSNISAKTTIFHLSGDNSVETPIWTSDKKSIVVERIKTHLFPRYIVYKKVKNTAYTRRLPFFLRGRPKSAKSGEIDHLTQSFSATTRSWASFLSIPSVVQYHLSPTKVLQASLRNSYEAVRSRAKFRLILPNFRHIFSVFGL